MIQHERGLEFKVGAFVFLGLVMLGALVVQFGRVGEGFKTYYAVNVRFADASGLLKGSDVLLAGREQEARTPVASTIGRSRVSVI